MASRVERPQERRDMIGVPVRYSDVGLKYFVHAQARRRKADARGVIAGVTRKYPHAYVVAWDGASYAHSIHGMLIAVHGEDLRAPARSSSAATPHEPPPAETIALARRGASPREDG